MIHKVLIKNFKVFEDFELVLNDGLNIIVGDNESGKSTILEAINLALTKRLNGRPIEYELSSYIFNHKCTRSYLDAVNSGTHVELPIILIEIYFENSDEMASLRGTNNSCKIDCPGIRLELVFDEIEFSADYQNLISTQKGSIRALPVEY